MLARVSSAPRLNLTDTPGVTDHRLSPASSAWAPSYAGLELPRQGWSLVHEASSQVSARSVVCQGANYARGAVSVGGVAMREL